MMKKALKRFLAVSCTAALLLTTSGVVVLADEMQEEEAVLSDISESESIQEELPEKDIQEYDDEDYIDESAENLADQVPDISENVDVKDSEKIVIEEVEEEPVSEDVSSNSQKDELEDNEAIVGAGYVKSGTCGDSVYWGTTLVSPDSDPSLSYSLTIYGQGKMRDYSDSYDVPWHDIQSSIVYVIIESGVTGIGDSAFEDCRYLSSITIPDSVTSIGDSAFKHCRYLSSITIPDSVTSIGDSAFCACSSLQSITIPDGVTSIGRHVFYYCSSLTSITLPDSVTSIGYSAFCGCSSLPNITLPDSVTSIEKYAFNNCSSLPNITIPDSVTSIEEYAFGSCSSLTSVLMSSNASSNYSMFSDCPSLIKIEGISKDGICWTLEKKDEGICHLTINGKGNMPDYRGVWLSPLDYEYDKEIYVSSSPWTLEGFDVTDIIIGKEVTNIGHNTFAEYNSLTNVTIPDSVTSIGDSAFSNCSSLPSITIPDTVTSIGDSAFTGCSSLTSITIPDSVTSIEEYAFGSCSSLTSVLMPSNASSNYSMFSDCPSLIKIEGISKDGICWTLEKKDEGICHLTINGKGDMPDYSSVCLGWDENGKNIYVSSSPWTLEGFGVTDIIIEKDVTNIGEYAFGKYSSLTSITIPDSVTSIGGATFSGCSSLSSITIPDSVTSIGASAFSGCSSLTSITIPDSVTSIGNGVFSGCSSLPSITIPDSVTSIGSYAFSGCSSLTSITIPDSVTSIGYYAFRGCSSLTSITIPDSVKKIGYSAFMNCSDLPSIALPNSVTSIGDSAFSGCSSLTDITIPDSVTSIGDSAFSGCSSLTDITIPDSVKKIGYSAFMNCSSLPSMALPNSVTSIGDSAFSGCSSLTSITLSDSVEYIGDSVFSNCISLKSITIPEKVYGMYSNAFKGCTSLETVILNGKYTAIEEDSFKDLPALKEIIILAPVRVIGSYAFSSCPNLKSIRLPSSLSKVGTGAFRYDTALETVYYNGSESQWNNISIANYNEPLLNANLVNSNDISCATIYTKSESYVYTGTPRDPSPIITLDGKTLVKGTDYDLTYENDVNVGTATVTAHGKGDYTGTVSCTYGITPRDINEGTSSTKSETYVFNGKPHHPDMILVVNNRTLVKDVDYTLTYKNDTEVGTATITAHGIGNYTGEKSCTFEIVSGAIDISGCSVTGNSLSYGYSGKAYTPAVTVKLDGVTLTKDTDYTVTYKNNVNPGTATITITGKGNYTGTRAKTFEIVDCVSSLVSGKTYQLIPKNNSKTAVSSFGGKMINNTKVYITDRSNSEAMKFKAVKNSDGTWKLINAKCELALAVQQNSSAVGAGLVLYDQTTRPAQNWKLSKKSDNSFAVINSVTGYSIAMSNSSAVKGTTLSMAETASSGLQRFYLAETSSVSAPYDGTKSVRASKDKNFALNIASSSKTDGANVNLYAYSNANAKKFKIIYSGGGYYRLVNMNSGLCLTVKGNTKTDGANVIQSKWAGESGQRWKITKNSNGTVTFTNALGTVLHLNGNKAANDTNVQARNASTTGAQKWYLQ